MATERVGIITQEFILAGEPQYTWQTYEETLDDSTTMGEIFRSLRSWHGRCDSSVRVETDNGLRRVGWHFIKRCDDGHGCIGTWATVIERTTDTRYAPMD